MADFTPIPINGTAEQLERLLGMEISTEIGENSTDDQLATAKAVYEASKNSAGSVKYDDVQNLTDGQEAQARKNINAMRNGFAESDLDMDAHSIQNAETISTIHKDMFGKEDGGVIVSPYADIYDEDGKIVCGVLEFSQKDQDAHVVLRRLHGGINDNDAATVGQLKSVDITTPKSFTEEQKAQARQNIGVGEAQAVTDEKYFLIDDDGMLSLKPEYRGLGGSGYDYSKSNNGFGVEGSLIAELPENIVIPEVVNEIAVNALAPAMFYKNNRVKRLTIPGFITEIPERFCDQATSLEQIDGTENVEIIGKAAFQLTKLKKVVFPKLKTALTTATFKSCLYLMSADIGNDVVELPKNCFQFCERLSSIRGGANVSVIGEGALGYTLRLKKIPFADKLTNIGKLGIYLSRVNYDWSQHSATYGENATYAHYKSPYTQINYWTGYWDTHTITPCEIPLRTLFNQANPQWLVDAEQAGFIGDAKTQWPQNCALIVYAAMYSFYEQKDLSSPVEYMCAVREADPDAINIHPGREDGPDYWLKPLGYAVEDIQPDHTSKADCVAAIERVYKALSEGKLVYAKVVSAKDPGAGNHAVLLYGINSSGEVLVFNPGNYSGAAGDYTPFTYAMPLQNMIPARALFHIVTKNAPAEAQQKGE